jgi:hypothetical protein
MRNSLLVLALCAPLLACTHTNPAHSYRPSFEPAKLSDRPLGKSNQVMVLASPHLSGMPDSFRLELIDPLVTRLVQWKPQAIAVEVSSGLLCDSMRRNPERSDVETIRAYCYDTTSAQRATGLDVQAANAFAERTLAKWPSEPSAEARRALAATWLAAGEPESALVQWTRLPVDERRADRALTPELVAYLNAGMSKKNEVILIAVRVAAELGLERVWSVDDQSIFVGKIADERAYGEALSRAWDNPTTKARSEQDLALQGQLAQPDGLLNMYRAYNAPSYGPQAYQSDWGAALVEPSPQAYGRQYVAYWETRNLRMVANIREVLGRKPGIKMLTIVGASHKAYFEAYLSQMRDVELVDVGSVLK